MSRIWINRVTSEIVSNRIFGQWRSKLHDERMIAVQEDFDLHSEFHQRDVTDGMRVSWNYLLTWKRGESREGAAEGTEERVLALRTEQLR